MPIQQLVRKRPLISISVSAAANKPLDAMGGSTPVPLFLLVSIYTGDGEPLPGLYIDFTVGHSGGTDTHTLGPTDSLGFARLCPAAYYPFNENIVIDVESVTYQSVSSIPLTNINVLNIDIGETPEYCIV